MTEQITRVLFIDLENCPSQVNQLMTDLENYHQIVICYAQSGAKIPIDWIVPLTAIINDGRLKLIKMPSIGKNAADFGITFWAGVLMNQLPMQSHFDIVSNDADLDYVVNLLSDQKRSAERIGIKKENLVTTEVNSTATKINFADYCLYLNNANNNKPAKKDTLLNSIKSKYQSTETEASQLFEVLIKNGVVTINENKITYNQQKIKQFASST